MLEEGIVRHVQVIGPSILALVLEELDDVQLPVDGKLSASGFIFVPFEFTEPIAGAAVITALAVE